MLKTVIKISATIIIIIALLSYWVNPTIFIVALFSFIVVALVKKKPLYLIPLFIFIPLVIVLILNQYLGWGVFKSHLLPKYYEVKYTAFGKYSKLTKKIELQERIGFKKLKNETEKIQFNEYIAILILRDSTFLSKDLYSAFSSHKFQTWLNLKGWKVESIPKDTSQDIFLWISRIRKIDINEKWYKPISQSTIFLPKTPLLFDDVPIIPIQGSELLIDMPIGMVLTTSPPNVSKSKGIDYERVKIPLEIVDKSIELKLLSWPWRSKVLYLIAKYIFWNPLMWFIGVLTAIFADRIKSILSNRFWEQASKKHSSS